MHYEADAFSKNGQATIITKDPKNQRLIGQTSHISVGDVAAIKRFYNCK